MEEEEVITGLISGVYPLVAAASAGGEHRPGRPELHAEERDLS